MSDNKKHLLKRIRSSALIKNPLLFEAVGLCPVVAAALSLKSAIFLAAVTAVEMFVCELAASLLLKNMRRYWRVAVYVLLSLGVLFPITYLTQRFFPNIATGFGIFLPLFAVNSLVALHCERVAVKSTVSDSLVDAVCASLSYGAVAVLVGLLREILAVGTVWEINLHLPVTFPALTMPFGALLIMGFAAAGLKAILKAKYPDKSPDKAFDTSEIRRSLRAPIKELMQDDFNPYDDALSPAVPAENTEKPKSPKPEKAKKPKKEKAHSKKAEKREAPKPAERRRERPEQQEHTYLDDFSEMLSDLEERKARYEVNTENEENKENSEGGGEE